MDVTIGSGWSYGGPYITPDLAAARLRSDRREITPDRTLGGAAGAVRERPAGGRLHRQAARRQEADPRTFRELDISGDGPIPLPPGRGAALVLFYFSSHSGQIVKRAALGAEGYVLDHYSAAARSRRTCAKRATSCWRRPGPAASTRSSATASRSTTPTGRRTCSSSSARAAATTCARCCRCSTTTLGERSLDAAARLRAHAQRAVRGALPRARCKRVVRGRTTCSSGSRTTASRRRRISSARHADLIDGEGWNFRELTSSRWASSASHLFGKPVTTSETWTWLHSPGLPRHAARREGGGRPALPVRHQPAHRPRLALLAAAGGQRRAGRSTPPPCSPTRTRGGR